MKEINNIINLKRADKARNSFIPVLHLEAGETIQELFDRLPNTIYNRIVKCIANAKDPDMENIKNDKVILFYLGNCDVMEIPASGWIFALKNAEKYFRDNEEYELCAEIVKLLNPLEDAITIE